MKLIRQYKWADRWGGCWNPETSGAAEKELQSPIRLNVISHCNSLEPIRALHTLFKRRTFLRKIFNCHLTVCDLLGTAKNNGEIISWILFSKSSSNGMEIISHATDIDCFHSWVPLIYIKIWFYLVNWLIKLISLECRGNYLIFWIWGSGNLDVMKETTCAARCYLLSLRLDLVRLSYAPCIDLYPLNFHKVRPLMLHIYIGIGWL